MTTTLDQIDQIRKLKERRYSKAKIAKKLMISRSTVVKYWPREEAPDNEPSPPPHKMTPEKLDLDDLFVSGKCQGCGITYPKPKFMTAWICPGCKRPDRI